MSPPLSFKFDAAAYEQQQVKDALAENQRKMEQAAFDRLWSDSRDVPYQVKPVAQQDQDQAPPPAPASDAARIADQQISGSDRLHAKDSFLRGDDPVASYYRQQTMKTIDRVYDMVTPGFGRANFDGLGAQWRFDYVHSENCQGAKVGVCLTARW